jgi:hypothetical protein
VQAVSGPEKISLTHSLRGFTVIRPREENHGASQGATRKALSGRFASRFWPDAFLIALNPR